MILKVPWIISLCSFDLVLDCIPVKAQRIKASSKFMY